MDYEIIGDGEAIKCLKCNMVSHSPMDVKYRWCGHCSVCLDPLMENEVARIRLKLSIPDSELTARCGIIF